MSILDKILQTKTREISDLKKKFKLEYFESSPLFKNPAFSLIKNISSDRNISIIAEIKKASPSKGILRHNFNLLEIAEVYLKNNIAGISILTDKEYFCSDITFLQEIAKIKSKPLLRKDFIIDEYQVYEAKASGADVILLICEALDKVRINELTACAQGIGLEVLLELHSSDQLNKIDFSINKMIGINNRNLNTFKTDILNTLELINLLPPDCIVVSESGIESEKIIKTLKDSGIDAILVGEYLMKSKSIDESLNQLTQWCKFEN